MTRAHTAARPDVYTRITDQILAQLEAGLRPWTQPWVSGQPVSRPLRHDGTPYTGVNVLLLWAEASAKGFTASTWMTFRQALALGAHVRKGETGSTVVYANTITRPAEDATSDDDVRQIPFLKVYTVFNVEQIEGLDLPPAAPEPEINPDQRNASIEAFFAATGAEIRHGGGVACYVPSVDLVRMPAFESFRDAESYYATLGHECVHWTGHKDRLARDFSRSRHAYACEELVAELGAAFLCADLGLAFEPRDDHAGYIGSWLQVLRNDKRFIVSAASQAQKAVAWLSQREGG